MKNLWLFRIKVIEIEQGALFRSYDSRSAFLWSLIHGKPDGELRKGYVWHIGNISQVDETGLLFAIGRTTKTSKELYDESSGDFLAVDDEEAPFTTAFYDSKLSVIGILPKARLAPSPKGIARNMSKLLNHQPMVEDNSFRIEISEIWDPEGFLQQVYDAYSVTSFSVEFDKPNPFDVQEEFHQPMERYLEASGGKTGKATVRGDDLDREVIEDVTRSVASTGKDVSARIRREAGQRTVTRHIRGDPVLVPAEDDHVEDAKGFLDRMRDAYLKIRWR
ncbi:hypothetical protein [Salinisphaera sp. Q1T1-3]|uniref:hypothetical protein n=1 Tax=Salinisphaera sp. Q1T1-3 TaxID=2321229 RepID=UPI0011C3FDB0|nr:hypothetical protein [Salinisphaera sp. Q1T1-3]